MVMELRAVVRLHVYGSICGPEKLVEANELVETQSYNSNPLRKGLS